MNMIIYYVVGTLDENHYTIKATELQVKKTAKNYKVENKNGASIWCKSLIPHCFVEQQAITEGYLNMFNRMRFESYCEPHNLDNIIQKIKQRIDEVHHKNVLSMAKVTESFKACVLITEKETKLWED